MIYRILGSARAFIIACIGTTFLVIFAIACGEGDPTLKKDQAPKVHIDRLADKLSKICPDGPPKSVTSINQSTGYTRWLMVQCPGGNFVRVLVTTT